MAVDRETLEEVEQVVLTAPGVVSLHPGQWGKSGTYLPGGMFPGIRVDDDRLTLHVTVDLTAPLSETVSALRDLVAAECGYSRVDVYVEDVVAAS